MAKYATEITFEAGSTTTVSNFTLAGDSGAITSLDSSSPGTQFTLTKSSGTVTASYLDIQDSNATGGAYWNASDGTNIDSGNNTGWWFTPKPISTVNGQFFNFF